MNRDDFREALLAVMERKVHWAWPAFTSGQVPRERLNDLRAQMAANRQGIQRFGELAQRYGIEQQAEIVRHAFLLRNGGKVAGAPLVSVYEDILPFSGH